jgi:RNA polymerase sigma-70 factor (ECF subfamily)
MDSPDEGGSIAERTPGSERSDAGISASERASAVAEALQSLPEEFRTVLVLRVVEEMSVEEVAVALEISTGTVKSRLYRAKEKMRELLESIERGLEFDID